MPTPLTTAVRRLRTLAAPAVDELPDRDLLARFRSSADEAAFAALVARHGPAVLGVCRRVLADRHAADDAFQATFLTLARKAGGVRNPAAVGCWLHGVAFRVASKLRGRLARFPRTGDLPEVPTSADDVSWREVRRVLDEEVTRLPDRLRGPVLLCYFEGKTRDEAADALGCKVTTLRGRLEDGRERLRARLARRGVELSAALLAVSTAADAPAVDEALVRSTVTAATGLSATAGLTAVRLMLMAVLAVGLGTTLVLSPGQGKQGPAPETPKVDPPKPADPPKPPDWGDPAGDFRLRLRSPAPVKVGELPELVTELKFAGTGHRFIPNSPEMLEVEVNGLWYRVPGGFTTEAEDLAPASERAPWLTVRPTSTWVHLRDRPGAAADDPQEAVPLRLAAGKHAVRVAYRFGRTDRAVSNAVTFEVLPDGWGQAWRGIKARVRPATTKLRAGEPLKFDLDLKNVGKAARTMNPLPYSCTVEIDGLPYRHAGDIDYKFVPREIAAGTEVVPFVTVTTDGGWRRARVEIPNDPVPGSDPEPVPLRLTPGKHVLRVQFPLAGPGVEGNVVSNEVTIEVQAAAVDPKLAALARGADRIWVVPSPARDKPVPEPVRVLKGPPGRADVFDLRLLPADNPKKQWIVFLQAQEEGQGVPVVKPLAGPTWSVPFDEGTAAAVREAVLPTAWGDTAGGLQMALRLREASVGVGAAVVAEVVIRNADTADRTFEQHRMNIYDYWPETTFRVTTPAGTAWILRRPAGEMDEFDRPAEITLQPGATYAHAVRIDRWQAVSADPRDQYVAPRNNLFAAPGEYTITALYVQPKTRIRSWAGSLTSQPAKLTVTASKDVPSAGWGPELDGIQTRVRVTKPAVAGEPLTFALDVRNRGTRDHTEAVLPFDCEIHWNGDWYTYFGPIDHKASPRTVTPGGQTDDWTMVTTDSFWRTGGRESKPLALTPGAHSLVVRYPMRGSHRGKAESQIAYFEVAPTPWGEAAEGIQARVRVTNVKPIAGDPLTFELDLRNRGTKDFVEAPVPYHCQIELDGWPYTYRAPISYLTGDVTIKPNDQVDKWVAVKTDEWWAAPVRGFGWSGPTPPDFAKLAAQTMPLYLTPGKHKLRVSYQMTGANKVKVISQETEFEVARSEWSGPVEGIRARVRPAKAKFRDGEPLAFALDLMNTGRKDLVEAPVPTACEIEVDGRRFFYTGPIRTPGKVVTLKPNMQIDGWTSVTTDPLWKQIEGVRDPVPLTLTPGKHTLRVWYQMTAPNKMKVVAQDVEFEVEPGDWGPTADGVQGRVRVTTLRPVAGDPLTFELDLRNRGDKDFVEAPVPFHCEIELDGRAYKYQLPVSYPTADVTIKPGGHVDGWTKVTATADWAHVGPPAGGFTGPMPPGGFGKLPPQVIPFALTPGKHTLHVFYQTTGRTRTRIVTQATEFTVAKQDWGPPAEGIRARVRPAKDRIKEGEPLTFSLDLKNEGTKDLVEAPVPFSCRFELDGRPIGYTGPIGYTAKVVTLKPGGQIDDWTKVTTDRWWTQTLFVAADLDLSPGKHTLRASYQMTAPNKMEVVSQTAEFEVEPVLVPTADRIVVATFDGRDTMGLKPVRTLKGAHNTWQPDVQRVAIPANANTLPNPDWAREWLVFLKAEEDGREVPKLTAAAVDWYKLATPEAIQAVKDQLKPPTEAGPAFNGLTVGLRRAGGADDGARLEVVLTNRAKEPLRVFQQRYNVYDYWPFLTFTVTQPDGTTVTLAKPDGEFKREDYVGERVLDPGENYIHTVRLDQWPDPRKLSEDLGPLFGQPGRYKVRAAYAVPGKFKNRSPKAAFDDHVYWAGEIVSNELTIEVGAAGKERLADFRANAGSLHLTLSRRPRADGTPPADGHLLYTHLDRRPVRREPHGKFPDGRPMGIDSSIVEGEGEHLLATLAADGFFANAAGPPGPAGPGDFLVEVWHEGPSKARLRRAYGWTEDDIRRLTNLAKGLFGGHPDLVKDVLAPVADTVPPWGDPVQGLVCRVTNVRSEEKAVRLDLDVWNRGTETWALTLDGAFADLEVDGVWYVPRNDRPVDVLSMIFKPGMRTDRPIPLSTADGWKEKAPPGGRAPKPLTAEPGKHKVRAAFEISRAGKTVRVVSNPAEVEVPK